MTDVTDIDAELLRRALAWMKAEEDPDATEVTSLTGRGSDWDGDTEGGFYSTFAVDVHYVKVDGRKAVLSPEGEQMERLWNAIVSVHRSGAGEEG
jgi:hypothetical protein